MIANHLWKQFFGDGLVRTMGDYGLQGEPPAHPELLDWLAVEFVENGWNIKALQRRIVMSATYRQASTISAELAQRDPHNRLLARGARFRLSAEEIRDAALAISGLLSRKIGGPSVNPYQPAGYFDDKSPDWKWKLSAGEDLYRRGLYPFWRRPTMYPSFLIFDAPDRGQCSINRPRTNTPLQALVTLNDPVFVEAARVFAQRILAETRTDVESRLVFAFRRALARPPSADEFDVLRRLLHDRLERYQSDTQAATKLASHGMAPQQADVNLVELAAWTSVAQALLNLDETVTRE